MPREQFIFCWEQQPAEVGMERGPQGGIARPAGLAASTCGHRGGWTLQSLALGAWVPLWDHLPLQKHSLPPTDCPMFFQNRKESNIILYTLLKTLSCPCVFHPGICILNPFTSNCRMRDLFTAESISNNSNWMDHIIYLSVCLSIYLSIYLSVYLPIICPSFFLSSCLWAH